MNRIRTTVLAAMLATLSATAWAEDYGEMLYANHCTGCHESTVHVREHRKATTLADLESWVRRWSGYQELDWGSGEVEAVRDYLNLNYYGLFDEAAPLPPTVSD